MTNIYDTANQLERELRTLTEFEALEQAYKAVQADEPAFKLFKEFQSFQQELQEKQMRGEDFSEEDAQKAQSLATEVQGTELINKMMEKEQAFSMIVNDLNRIIMTPIRDLYEN
ncbi:YlbF family regulator [Enterococcus sp. BWB1-3]|uniref:YlbF family regulator n=1 Tax=unclassified Enterococcus TaxID=2608891 RepID=UPI001921C504|nr:MULTISPECIES: YlbF family regulator [unclassified Enterococcus]MBL1228703.1 YlbF family regulator [Enterococcus sp. BWB1-3]MCB5952775.1 YlbF family regulator [Enterococcus sp. BWT-B8]MCB5953693.1 YlbF family regulator [Enterococcus sp. CWB-B31]